MDTRQLAAFCEVVERRSFSEAAARLGVTQPAVSQQVRALEQRLGTQLLDRSGRRVEPTEAGLRLYRGAQRMLALEEQLLDELAEPDAPLHGTLELGASTGPAAIVLPVLLCEFQRQNTELRVELSVSDTQSVVELVADRRLELGIVGAARRHRSVAFEPFFRDEVDPRVPARASASPVTHGRARPARGGPAHPDATRAQASDRWSRTSCARPGSGCGICEVPLELGLQESVRSAVAGWLRRRRSSPGRRSTTELAAGTLVEARVRGLDLARDIYIARASGRAGLECSAGVRRLRAGAASGVIVRWGLEELPGALEDVGLGAAAARRRAALGRAGDPGGRALERGPVRPHLRSGRGGRDPRRRRWQRDRHRQGRVGRVVAPARFRPDHLLRRRVDGVLRRATSDRRQVGGGAGARLAAIVYEPELTLTCRAPRAAALQ